MKALKTKLSIVLALQLLLAAGLWALNRNELATAANQSKLLSFDVDEVDKIELSSKDNTVALGRVDKKWTLQDFHGLEADREKADSLLRTLSDLKSYNLVSRTSTSHDRFEVSEEKCNTRITLKSGEEELANLLLGKSPRFGRRYLRLSDGDEVYDVAWDSLTVQTSYQNWFNHDLLAPGALSELSLSEFTLKKSNGKWSVGEQELDQKKVGDLIKKVERLSVFEVSEESLPADFEVKLKTADSKELTWTFMQKDSKYFVRSSERELTFQMGKDVYESLKDTSLEDFVTEESAEETSGQKKTE